MDGLSFHFHKIPTKYEVLVESKVEIQQTLIEHVLVVWSDLPEKYLSLSCSLPLTHKSS